jgi:hypothetical protein
MPPGGNTSACRASIARFMGSHRIAAVTVA